jgi:hypothetical protein
MSATEAMTSENRTISSPTWAAIPSTNSSARQVQEAVSTNPAIHHEALRFMEPPKKHSAAPDALTSVETGSKA